VREGERGEREGEEKRNSFLDQDLVVDIGMASFHSLNGHLLNGLPMSVSMLRRSIRGGRKRRRGGGALHTLMA
jgi:hypothetical protein